MTAICQMNLTHQQTEGIWQDCERGANLRRQDHDRRYPSAVEGALICIDR
jgi:hypothetical protein